MAEDSNEMLRSEQAVIIKGVGGLYSVYFDGRIYDCPARGIFRKEGIKPLVGDRVVLGEIDGNKNTAVIDKISERKNSLIRPSSANIDMIAAVVATGRPEPDLLLLDKLIVSAEMKKIDVLLIINKADNDPQMALSIEKEYKNAVLHCAIASTKDSTGREELLRLLKGKTTILAGQSGAGKSSLTNFLSGSEIMETGDLSRKTERGKNTTRHTEMFILPKENEEDPPSFIIDSPGFSLFETEQATSAGLKDTYREIYMNPGLCRFQDCSHTGEPDCFVRKLVEKGVFPKGRYERYVHIFKELKKKERDRYK